MKKYNWSKLPPNRAYSREGQTIWDRVVQVQSQKHQGIAVNFEEIEKLFSQLQVVKKDKKKDEKKKANAIV